MQRFGEIAQPVCRSLVFFGDGRVIWDVRQKCGALLTTVRVLHHQCLVSSTYTTIYSRRTGAHYNSRD
jgi:hypothetical protein